MHRTALRSRIGRSTLTLVVLALTALVTVQVPAGASTEESAARPARPRLSTPERIDQAVAEGRLNRHTGNLYMAYALSDYSRVPRAYRGNKPYHGTLILMRLELALKGMAPGQARNQLKSLLAPPDAGSFCSTSAAPLALNVETAHFYVEYSAGVGGASGLTITNYTDSLETAWTTEIDSFGWAQPPSIEALTPPDQSNGKYHVRIDPALDPGVYGFVSSGGKYAGAVGDNPHTAWNDVDAQASCMVLANDYTIFPGSPQRALDATTAHEFNHSIQYGIGAITGGNSPDASFIEGGATWMEDEVFDGSNDNYNYLWPTFADDMGHYTPSPYPYWITFRGLTEQFGASVADGGENVMQTFWELTSQSATSNMLDALNTGLVAEGTNLKDAYHAYAIAVKFLKACGGGYAYPYCLEEGPQYRDGDGVQTGAGPTAVHGTIGAVPGSFNGSLPDNYALQWVALPLTGGPYSVTVNNTAAAGLGALRTTVACDTGAGFTLAPLPAVVGGGASTTLASFNPAGCASVVAVVTNERQTAANPGNTPGRPYTLSVGAPTLCPGAETVLGTHIVGTAGDDTLTGTPGNDVICGLGGNDTLTGGDGNDFLLGGNDNDNLDAGDGVDRLAPGLGDDTAEGGTGTGPANTGDTVTYYDITGEFGVTVDLSQAAGQNTVSAGTDTISGVESITGSKQDDILTGNGSVNYLTGGLGEDLLSGAGGNDVLQGLQGDDSLDGGEGIDTASYKASPAGTIVNISAPPPTARGGTLPGTAQDGWSATDDLTSIESVSGSDVGSDDMIGSSGNDFLYGQGNNDVLRGEDGNDYLVGGSGTADHLDGGNGSDTCRSGETNIECENISARGAVVYPWMFNSELAFLEAVARAQG